MAALLCQHLAMKNSIRRIASLNSCLSAHFSTQQRKAHNSTTMIRDFRQTKIDVLEPKLKLHVHSFHSGNMLYKKSSKTIKGEELELVNVLSPLGVVLAEGSPIIFVERMCNSFHSYTYKECTDKAITKNVKAADCQGLRNLQLVKKEILEEPSGRREKKNKGPSQEKIASIQDYRTIRKLQADIVNAGESLITLKCNQGKHAQRKVAEVEQFVKNHLQDICTFHEMERRSNMAVFRLKRQEEDKKFYKNIFDIIYNREKDEVDMMMDYYKTVKSFSEESQSSS